MKKNKTNIMSYLFMLSVLFTFTAESLFAQGTVTGKVTDSNNNALLAANVILTGTNYGAATNSEGMYLIQKVPAGTYTIRISMVGYSSVEYFITVPVEGTVEQNAVLKEDILNMESVVITGTPGGAGVRKKDASFAITTMSAEEIRQLSPPSTAAALELVPGVWSESSGGVAGANIFVRGLPSSGDAPFVTMAINGAPIYGTQTLSFFEQSSIFRIDETVLSIEALRGGPSSVFSNGEAGLTTNFNLRKGTAQTEGLVKYTTSDYSEQRLDAVLSGPISDGFYYMVGGYLRTSPGIRDTEFNSERGKQFTFQLTKVFDKGVLNGFARLTDDHGQWILPMALGTGNDPGTFSPLGNSTRFRTLQINEQGDNKQYDFSSGRGWKGIVSGINFDYDLGDGWTVRDNLSYTGGMANTLGFVPNGSPMLVSDLAAKMGTGSLETVGGKTLTSGYVQSYGHWVVEKQLESFTNDISLTKKISDHNITLGAYQAFWASNDFWTLGNHILVENVTNGDIIKNIHADSVAGSWNYGLNESGDARAFAIYAGDSWQVTDKLRLDLGGRYQFWWLNFTLDHGAYPDGVIDKVANLDGEDWAATAAVNYAVTNDFGVFVRGSKGSLFPHFDQIRDGDNYNLESGELITDAGGNVLSAKGTVAANLFNQYEVGVKYEQEILSLFITGFLNTVEVFDGDVGAARAAALLKTRTFGAEIDGGLSISGFKLKLVGTFQSGEITEAPKAPETVGNKIWRQPDLQFRIAPSYKLKVSESVSATLYGAFRYIGTRWNDRDNSYELDSFTKLDLGINVTTTSGLSFDLSSDNLTDSDGLTEGDPRDPTTRNGRPILGRSIKFSIGVNF